MALFHYMPNRQSPGQKASTDVQAARNESTTPLRVLARNA